MGGPPKQQPAEDPTAWVKAEDESLATNESATAIPLGWGETKTTCRWFTRIYGQRVVQVKNKSGGKGK
jgi:hypothetical protein